MIKSKKSVLVCKSKWIVRSGTEAVYKNNKFFYVNDGKIGVHASCDIQKLARELHRGSLLSGPVKFDEIEYALPQTAIVDYVDGYFGRPAIPSDIYFLSVLPRKERRELKQILSRLENDSSQ